MRIIAAQFAMKNTMGYGLNSLVDHTRPVDILTHLVIGSEGTLAFVASAVFRTVPLLRHAMTGLLVFEDLSGATGSLPALVSTGPATIELLDATSLRVAQSDPACDEIIRRITVDKHSALLVEYQADSVEAVAEMAAAAAPVLRSIPVAGPAELTADPRARARLWHTRKGLYTTVERGPAVRHHRAAGGHRRPGAAAAGHLRTADRAVRQAQVHRQRDLRARQGRQHPLHAHRAARRRGRPAPVRRVHRGHGRLWCWRNGGNLKAEHGTGRIMAPFVRRQYGDELYEVMREIKQLCDPAGLLNPGVIVTDDDQAHLRDLKVTPTVEQEVDRCVECGYCEPVCPSRDLTTTPRQRIVLRREMQRAREAGDTALLDELEAEYDYDGVQTCAVDGMCATACPVLINTGDLVRRLRAETVDQVGRQGLVVRREALGGHHPGRRRRADRGREGARSALIAGPNELGRKLVITGPAAAVLGRAARRRPAAGRRFANGRGRPRGAEIVFFSACVGTMFGPTDDGPGARESFERLCERAGIAITYPQDLPRCAAARRGSPRA